MFKNLNTFINDESGQGTTEYLLILAAAIAIVLIFKEQILAGIRGLANTVSSELENAVPRIMSTGN
jgi:Flp pilus assembly pilin Flp